MRNMPRAPAPRPLRPTVQRNEETNDDSLLERSDLTEVSIFPPEVRVSKCPGR